LSVVISILSLVLVILVLSPSLSGSRLSVVISILSLVLVILVLSLVVGWFWGVPSRITEQEQEVERLENLIEKQQFIIDQLLAEKSESVQPTNTRNPQSQDLPILDSRILDVISGEDDTCALPPVPGPCTTASIQRWHYHAPSRTCRQFTFGGCLGNKNNFPTVMDCERTCEGYTAKNPIRIVNKENYANDETDEDLEICTEGPLAGPCRGHQLRYYYDLSQDSCNQFSYGGCAGNRNNFVTEEDCTKTCKFRKFIEPKSDSSKFLSISSELKKTKVSLDKSTEVCSLSLDVGPCSNNQKRWFYSSEDGACQQFMWGGCLGNFNNFISKAKCEARCGLGKLKEKQQGRVNCLKPRDQGTCKGIFERFYYNLETETCEDFVYGGCGGNENNFLTREKCNTYCIGDQESIRSDKLGLETDVDEETVDEICAVSSDPGECKGDFERFHYNIVSEGCEPFIYGGCGGNKNNFVTKEACTDFCINNNK